MVILYLESDVKNFNQLYVLFHSIDGIKYVVYMKSFHLFL